MARFSVLSLCSLYIWVAYQSKPAFYIYFTLQQFDFFLDSLLNTLLLFFIKKKYKQTIEKKKKKAAANWGTVKLHWWGWKAVILL